jgi:hypothetical protein
VRNERAPAGVVDQDVQPAELFHRLGHQPDRLGLHGNIGFHGEGPNAELPRRRSLG